jgi:hypothetical protein
VLERRGQRQRRPARAQRDVQPDERGVGARGGGGAVEIAHQHGDLGARRLGAGQLGVVLERRLAVPRRLRLGHPELHAVQRAAVVARRLLGVRQPAPGGHEVELPWADDLLAAQAVAVQHLPVEQVGHGVQAGVRVRADVDAAVRFDGGRSEVVDEAPRADRAALAAGQHAADGERADGRLARVEDLSGRRLWRAALGLLGSGVGPLDGSAHQPTAAAAARPAVRPEKTQPPRNVPSSERYPCTPPPPKPATSPAA